VVTPVDVIREVYAGFDRGSIRELLAWLHPQVEWNEAEHVTFWPGSPFIGPEAVIRGLFARIPETFGDTWRIEIDRLFESGSTVIMQGRYSGTVQATGEHFSPQVAHIWELDDDRIVRFQQYTDTWLFATATGIAPFSG
jgi:ketosteroid isomerase-like protein